MHCIRRAALRAASGTGSRVAFAAQRATLPPSPITSSLLLKSAAAPLSRAFSTSRFLSNNAEQASSPGQDASAEVVPNDSTQQPRRSRGGESAHSLFVRNLPFDATEESLSEAFSTYGEVGSVVVMKDARGMSRGFGFVNFTTAEAMEKAAAGANGNFWNGRRIYCAPRMNASKVTKPDVPLTERQPTKTLFIGNIPYETTDADLSKLFREMENLANVRVAFDRSTGWPRGFAHADFTDAESALKAGLQIQKMQLLGRALRVDFSAERSERSRPHRQQHQHRDRDQQ